MTSLSLFLLLSAATSALAEEPVFRFGVLSDIQYAELEPSGSTHYRESPKKLKDAAREFNQQNLTFTIHLGDFIQEDFESFGPLLDIWNDLKMKRYQVLGNHDYSVSDAEKSKIASVLGLEKNYYDFHYDNWHFFVLDGNEISFHAHSKESPAYKQALEIFSDLTKQKKLNARDVNGAVSQKQLDWLDQGLSQACRANKRAVIFSHYPIYPEHPLNLWNDETLRNLLEKHACVFAHMNGHQHQGSYAVKNGIHYVTFHGMVETKSSNAYAVLEVYPNSLKIKGFGREPSRTLKLNAKDTEVSSQIKHPKTEMFNPTEVQKSIPRENSKAFAAYQKRKKSELSKLIYLIDRFHEKNVLILYDNTEYNKDFSRRVARKYLSRHYNKEKAAVWIKKHTYRSLHGGNPIQLRFPDGDFELMRDAFLKELSELEKMN